MTIQLFRLPKTKWFTCGYCEGQGELPDPEEPDQVMTCKHCEGLGEIETEDTPHWDYD